MHCHQLTNNLAVRNVSLRSDGQEICCNFLINFIPEKAIARNHPTAMNNDEWVLIMATYVMFENWDKEPLSSKYEPYVIQSCIIYIYASFLLEDYHRHFIEKTLLFGLCYIIPYQF